MRRLLQAVSLLVLFALCAILAAPFTATGSRALTGLISRFSPVEIRYTSGALFGELELAAVSVPLESLSLRLDAVRSEMNPRCLLGSQLCWERLHAGAVELKIEADDSPSKQPPRRQLLELPFGLSAEMLTVDRLSVLWPGGSWVSDLDTSLVLSGSQLDIARLSIREGRLSLEDLRASEFLDRFGRLDQRAFVRKRVAHTDGLRSHCRAERRLARGSGMGGKLQEDENQ